MDTPMFSMMACGCYEGMEKDDCICGINECAIRHYSRGTLTIPMSVEQRAWCIDQADWAGEGYYTKEELAAATDKELANKVLHAWNMYVQSHY
jgi:hypothetical protein